ncbi:PTS sugar transporter subunit IIA [Pleionea sediminis]|uniref:PTS sugar transporter subunit IIA n=1 Tax=Pleionea sediminis TaxID=2569479 RepID=UPI0011850649|nr:PTS sugar transporter subunit IIA [Pleionea sediminis]
MGFLNCLKLERTRVGAQASSKKRAFEMLSELIAHSCDQMSEQNVLDSLFTRERLGCTGIGRGIAIPHGRCNSCNGPVCAILMLDSAVDYDSPDGQPVDILFAVLVPEDAHDEHIECLSSIANLLQQDGFCRQLRNAYNDQALYDIVKTGFEKQTHNL